MKRTITKLVLLLLAVLTTGSVKATEYNFYEGLSNGTTATKGDPVTVGGFNMWKLKYVKDGEATKEFDGKFAYGARTNGNDDAVNYRFMNAADYKGLEIIYDNRTFAILGLTNGQRIKITTHQGSLSFVGQPALSGVASGATVESTYYTVSTSDPTVDILLKSDVAKTEIKTVEILDATTTEKVTVGVAGVDNTYDFTNMTDQTSGAAITSSGDYATNTIIIADANDKDGTARTFDGRFAVNVTGGNGWKWRYNSDARYNGLWAPYADKSDLYIRNLKAGDVVTITYGAKEMKIADGDATETTGTSPYTIGKAGDLHLVANDAGVHIKSIKIETPEQNIGGATLVSENGLDFTDLSIKAYVATSAASGSVTFTQVNKVPAGTPLYLKANAVVSVDVPVITDGFETITTNLLYGSATDDAPLTSDADTKYYVFGVQDDIAGFYRVPTSGFTSAAGKAYLELTAEQAASSRISMIFDEGSETTGINMIQSSEVKAQESDAYYNLAGQRVVKPTRGLYIVNGKKVFIK